MYRGRLTAAIVKKAADEGKEITERYVGGVKFSSYEWTTFDEDNANMHKINAFYQEGWLKLEPLTTKDSRPPVEIKQDLKAQAEEELLEDAEIEAEVEAILDGKCHGIKADGTRCTRNAQEGSLYCKTHEVKNG